MKNEETKAVMRNVEVQMRGEHSRITHSAARGYFFIILHSSFFI
jgi:hypothetical protein